MLELSDVHQLMLVYTDLGVVSFAQPSFDVTATSGQVTLLITRSGNCDNTAFVTCETNDLTATSGVHYRGNCNVIYSSKTTTN